MSLINYNTLLSYFCSEITQEEARQSSRQRKALRTIRTAITPATVADARAQISTSERAPRPHPPTPAALLHAAQKQSRGGPANCAQTHNL